MGPYGEAAQWRGAANAESRMAESYCCSLPGSNRFRCWQMPHAVEPAYGVLLP